MTDYERTTTHQTTTTDPRTQHARADWKIGVGCHRAPAPVGERRPQSLPAPQHEFFECGGQVAVIGADVGVVAAAFGQIHPQLVGDGAGQLDG